MTREPRLEKRAFLLRIVRTLLIVSGVAAAYYVTGRAIVALGAPPNGAITTVWLPSGITVAALLRFGRWPAAGAFIGSLALDCRMGTPLTAGILVAIANSGSEYLCYKMMTGGASALRRLEIRSVARLLIGSLVASLLSAAIGVTAYVSFGVIPAPLYLSLLITWFGSCAVGIVLVAPFLICTLDDWSAAAGGVRRLEFAATLAALACAAFLWQGPTLSHEAHEPLVVAVLILFLWIAYRFPTTAMAGAVFLFATATVGGAVLRVAKEPQETAFIAIFGLQLILAGVAVFGYLLASLVSAQRRATEGVRLAAKVYETTSEGIVVTTPEGAIIDANSAFEQITGYPRAEVLGQHPSFLRSDRHPMEFYKSQVHALLTLGEWQGEVWYRRADGTLFPGWMSLTAVRDAKGTITEFVGILSDITELREAQTKLLDSARHAGMAEIATNMLHNIGNVLNSVNVSAGSLQARVHASKVVGLTKASTMLKANAEHLPDFLLNDPKGKLLPDYLEKLATTLSAEQQEILEEVGRISRSIDHIKDIVATQQSYAGASTLVEMVQVRTLLEDALRMNAESLTRHTVTVVRDFRDVPEIPLDKARIMMILVNLIRNAKHAMGKVTDREQVLTLRLRLAEKEGGHALQIAVQDVGEGICEENLTRIFAHGFTTKKDGHGFGLHSCALAASEMGGTLTAVSAGPGRGATFTLELPVQV